MLLEAFWTSRAAQMGLWGRPGCPNGYLKPPGLFEWLSGASQAGCPNFEASRAGQMVPRASRASPMALWSLRAAPMVLSGASRAVRMAFWSPPGLSSKGPRGTESSSKGSRSTGSLAKGRLLESSGFRGLLAPPGLSKWPFNGS